MEKGYVYIGRHVNHTKEFFDNYYKIGRSKQYKIRETQLTNTNGPYDYYNIRVFETDDMAKVESILHVCFEDYRAIKTYPDRKDIRTEFFWITDEEILHKRVDKLIKLLGNVTELDLTNDIENDISTTKEEKQKLIETFRKAKSSLSLVYKGEDISQETSTETFLLCLRKISEQSSWEQILENETRVTKTLKELRDRYPSADSSQLKPYEDYVVFTGNNNEVKVKIIGKLIKKLHINDLHLSVKN
jgi:hypothetical protein